MEQDLMKGSIDLLLLSILSRRTSYGYEIMRLVKEKSGEEYEMGQGTLYPALKRLERKNWITSYWGESEDGRRRKFYEITDDGRTELEVKLRHWKKVNQMIELCLSW